MSGNRYSNCSILSGAIAALFLVVLGASPTLAQTNSSSTQDEWQVAVAIYLWGTNFGGETLRGSEIEVSLSDLLDNLEFAGMGTIEARKNNWSVLADIIYLGVGANNTTELSIPIGPVQVPVTTSTNVDFDSWVVNLLAGYNLYSKDNSRLDVVHADATGVGKNVRNDQDCSQQCHIGSRLYCDSWRHSKISQTTYGRLRVRTYPLFHSDRV